MAITVPQPGQEISATDFGAPVANQLNGIAPTVWTALPLSNSWVPDAGSPVQYRKIGDIVYIRGIARNGVITTGTIGATLPTGFRPPQNGQLMTISHNGTSWLLAELDIITDGTIKIGAGFPGPASGYMPMAFYFSTLA